MIIMLCAAVGKLTVKMKSVFLLPQMYTGLEIKKKNPLSRDFATSWYKIVAKW